MNPELISRLEHARELLSYIEETARAKGDSLVEAWAFEAREAVDRALVIAAVAGREAGEP